MFVEMIVVNSVTTGLLKTIIELQVARGRSSQ